MKILILNWRDPKNPEAGGAEQVTERYATYWKSKGYKVFWLANFFEEARKEEEIKGIVYKRVGPMLSRNVPKNIFIYPVYLLNSILTARQLIRKEQMGVVIDEIHGLPFFTPLYSKKRNILLVCEVAGSIWDKMWPFPINRIGKFLEKLIYWIYKDTEIWAISQSTKRDIFKLNNKLNVKILPLGIDTKKSELVRSQDLPKYEFPSAVFLARLVKMKGVESAIAAAKLIVAELPNFKLYIIGKGEPAYEEYLKNLVIEKGIAKNIEFLGFVSEEKKYEILARCHFLLHPSFKEGFGLTVLEAGLMGTPAIVKGGSSLDELVDNGVDGFIVQNEQEMAQRFIESVGGKSYFYLGQKIKAKSLKYDWKNILSKSSAITEF